MTTGCVAADTSLLGSICERAPLVWAAVWTCSEGLVAPFEVSREGLVVLLCEAGPRPLFVWGLLTQLGVAS